MRTAYYVLFAFRSAFHEDSAEHFNGFFSLAIGCETAFQDALDFGLGPMRHERSSRSAIFGNIELQGDILTLSGSNIAGCGLDAEKSIGFCLCRELDCK